MEDKIKYYRAPMVTATGILLGFVLSFGSSWVTKAFTSDGIKEIVIGTGFCTCISLLLIVLYRILNMNYPKDKAEAYYQRTLQLFIIGVSIVFASLIIVMIESYLSQRL